MKASGILVAVLLAMAGGAPAADLADLQNLNVSGIKALNNVPPGMTRRAFKSVAETAARMDVAVPIANQGTVSVATVYGPKVEYQYGEKVILGNKNDFTFTLVTFVGINNEGEAVIDFPIGELYFRRMTVPLENLAKTSGCSTDGFCVEQEALYILESFRPTSYRVGRIAGIRTDGKVILQSISGGLMLYNIIETEKLAHTKGCNDAGYCVGEPVLTPARTNGEIVGVFMDNTLAVRVDDPSFIVAKRYSSTQLSRP